MTPVIVQFQGRFGNNIFQLSAAIKQCNGDLTRIKANRLGPENTEHGFVNLAYTRDAITIPRGCYQSKEFLVSKEQLLYFIKKIDAPLFDTVLHIRGGDYKQPGWNRLQLNKQQLQEAINLLKVRNKDVFVVTDDPEYALSVMPEGCNLLHSADYLKDWWILRNANSIITSAGTFSYTAAYLSDAEKVIFPKIWIWDFKSEDFCKSTFSVTKGIHLKQDNWIAI